MFRCLDPDDALSRLSTVYQGTGTGTPLDTFTYADNGLVSNRSEGTTGASGATYGWDDVNRLASQSDAFFGGSNNVAWTFAYNPASQIATETRDNDSYAPTVTSGSTAYTPNGLNQYSNVGGTAYAYDANGNLTGTGAATYTYDIENRLVKAVAGGTTTNLIYDPLGRLYQTDQGSNGSTTRLLTDGDAMVLEFNSSNAVINRYVHGSNAAADDPLLWYSGSGLTAKRWLHADHLGSIVAWTNAAGGSPTLNTYDEYGVPGANNEGRFQYTGQAWIPELSLYYYKARFYDPKLGRFMQTDPVGYDDQINLYGYVTNDPVNQFDPNGLEEIQANTCSRVGSTACAGSYGGGFGNGDLLNTAGRVEGGKREKETDQQIAAREAQYLRWTVIIAYSRLCRCKVDPGNFQALSPNKVAIVDVRKVLTGNLFEGSFSLHGKQTFESRLPSSDFALKVYLKDSDAGGRNTIAISTPTWTFRHFFDALVAYPDTPINTFYARQYCYQTHC